MPRAIKTVSVITLFMLLFSITAFAGGLNEELFTAVFSGDTVAVNALLTKGADVNAIENVFEGGRTVLMLAARSGRTEVVKALLDKGANVNYRDSRSGQTALMVAANAEIIRLLKQAGAEEVPNAAQYPPQGSGMDVSYFNDEEQMNKESSQAK